MPGHTQQNLANFFLSRKERRLKKRTGRRKRVKEVDKRKEKKLRWYLTLKCNCAFSSKSSWSLSSTFHLPSTANSALLNRHLRFPLLTHNEHSLLHNPWSPSHNLPLLFKFIAISLEILHRSTVTGGWGGNIWSVSAARGRLRISYRRVSRLHSYRCCLTHPQYCKGRIKMRLRCSYRQRAKQTCIVTFHLQFCKQICPFLNLVLWNNATVKDGDRQLAVTSRITVWIFCGCNLTRLAVPSNVQAHHSVQYKGALACKGRYKTEHLQYTSIHLKNKRAHKLKLLLPSSNVMAKNGGSRSHFGEF